MVAPGQAHALGMAVWAALVAIALAWGTWRVADAGVALRAAPLAGRWRWDGDAGLAPAVVLGVAVLWSGPGLARRLDGRRLAVATGGTAALWALTLAASGGWDRVTAPLTTRHEYEPFAAGVSDVGGFLRSYVAELPSTPVHVQGHPPGPVVLAWGLDRLGLGGAGWLAVVVLAGWGVAAGAAVVAARAVAGDAGARRAAPALALLPAAVWAGTSLDAVFAALAGVTVALAALAARRAAAAPAPPADLRTGGVPGLGTAAAAGGVLGIALLSTYGAVPVAGVATAVLILVAPPDRRVALLVAAAGGACVVLVGVAAASGFWWPDGLSATSRRYWAGVGAVRPALYTTLVGNPAALALATGPAVAAGLATLVRPRRAGAIAGGVERAWLLPALALGAVAAGDLSQMSRGEVERIWLPFVPWLALAAPGDSRPWLAAQVAVALVLESALASPW